jgi:hypothetical protein
MNDGNGAAVCTGAMAAGISGDGITLAGGVQESERSVPMMAKNKQVEAVVVFFI